MPLELSDFYRRLHTDSDFRRRFVDNPSDVLREMGYDPDKLNLPSQVDPDALEQRLRSVFDQGQEPELPTEEHADLSPDELWDRFHVISSDEPHSATAEGDPATVVTVTGVQVAVIVAYAGPPVTGLPTTQVVTAVTVT